MSTRRLVALAAAVAPLAMLVALPLVHASDHLDGPRVTADPQSDITDVFAFTSPESPTRVVLAMAVTPYASDASTFSPLVDYAFRVQLVQAVSPLTLDGIQHDVVCEFVTGAPQTVTCTAPSGLAATATVGDTGGGTSAGGSGTMRVFAGLRSDPAFFDRQGALATIGTGHASFTGTNAFAGANVLAIVVEVDSVQLTMTADGGTSLPVRDAGDAGPGAPILAVAAETFRRGM
jgi:hypothetical protein